MLVISVVLAAFFYRLLPPEVTYHFQNGSPDRWLGRAAVTAWLVVPQALCPLFAFGIVRTAMLSARYLPPESSPMPRLLPVMGNMLALPQVILIFAMLDIFLYNAYKVKLMPVWVFAVIVMALGGIILGVFFVRTTRQFRRRHAKSLRE
ncbi:MAG: hypothetical protein ABID71_06990 [Chloroflexota bacterium]